MKTTDKVISLADFRKNPPKAAPQEQDALEIFKEAMERNKKNTGRMKRERAKRNEATKNNYKLK